MAVECPKCQTVNPETSTFCADCGTKLLFPEKAEVTKTLETPKEELTTGFTFAGEYQINPRPHEGISEGQFSRKGRQ